MICHHMTCLWEMSVSRSTVSNAPSTSSVSTLDGPGSAGDLYTMEDAARLKGVAYRTVTRAVRGGKLPVQRLGRTVLIAAPDLQAWEPARKHAPHRYTRREPDPSAAPVLLHLATGEHAELGCRLATLLEVLHGAAAAMPLTDFMAFLCDRLADALGLRRVVIWGVSLERERIVRLASYGAPFSTFPTEFSLAEVPDFERYLEVRQAFSVEDIATLDVTPPSTLLGVTSLFGAPLRVGDDILGFVFGDCNGERFTLSPQQLALAQGIANNAALALDRARLQAESEEQADRLAAVLAYIDEAVVAWDQNGRVSLVNAAARDLLGDPETFVTSAPLGEVLNGQEIQERDISLTLPGDGGTREVIVNARPIMDGDSVTGAIAIVRGFKSEPSPRA